MFDFMYRFRMPILLAIVVGMAGFGVWASLMPSGAPEQNEELASFEVRGLSEPIEGTVWTQQRNQTGQFIELTRRLGSQFGGTMFNRLTFGTGIAYNQKRPQEFIYGFEALRKVARTTDLVPNPNEVQQLAEAMATANLPPAAAQRQVAPTPELVQFVEDWLRIEMMRRQSMTDPDGVDFAAVLEDYQNQYSMVTAKYVKWEKKPPESYTLDLTKAEDKATLREWFDENPYVQNQPQNKLPEQVDLGVVYVRYFQADRKLEDLESKIDQRFASELAKITVTPEEIDARFTAWSANADANLPWQWILDLEAAKRSAANPEATDQPEPKDVLRPHIEREIKVAKLLGKVYEAAKNSDLATAAGQFGFDYHQVDKLTAQDLMSKHPSLAGGPRLWQMVRGAASKLPKGDQPGTYTAGEVIPYETSTQDGSYWTATPIFDEPGQLQGVFALRDYREARVPEFEEILDKVYKEWQTRQSSDKFNNLGRDFTKKAEEWVVANVESVREKKAELEADAKKAADEEIAERKLDREKEEDKELIEAIDKRHESKIAGELRPLYAEHTGKAFAEVAQEMGLEIKSFGPVLAHGGGPAVYPEGITEEEKLNRYLLGSTVISQIASLEEGAMTPFARADFTANLAAHFFVAKKEVPTAADMLQRPDRYLPIMRRLQPQPDYAGWSYEDFKGAHMLNISSPDLDDAKRLQEERDAKAAERSGGRAEREAERLRRLKMRGAGTTTPTPTPNRGLPTGVGNDPDQVNPDRIPPPSSTGG